MKSVLSWRPVTDPGRRILFFFIIFLGPLLLFIGPADSASFDIQPIRIFFNAKTRAEKLMIKNVSDDDLSLQVKAYKWSQNSEGKDIYDETSDIVVFPKVMKVPKGEEKIIRVGTTLHPSALEGTYRIYVEELPVEKPQTEGVGLRIAMKVGVPVFINPLKNDGKAALDSFTVQNGKAAIKVKNDGNAHFIITSLKLTGRNEQGAEIFSREFGGWYLLSGIARTYETDIPLQACNKIFKLSVALKTTRNSIQKDLNFSKDMCSPRGR